MLIVLITDMTMELTNINKLILMTNNYPITTSLLDFTHDSRSKLLCVAPLTFGYTC